MDTDIQSRMTKHKSFKLARAPELIKRGQAMLTNDVLDHLDMKIHNSEIRTKSRDATSEAKFISSVNIVENDSHSKKQEYTGGATSNFHD